MGEIRIIIGFVLLIASFVCLMLLDEVEGYDAKEITNSLMILFFIVGFALLASAI